MKKGLCTYANCTYWEMRFCRNEFCTYAKSNFFKTWHILCVKKIGTYANPGFLVLHRYKKSHLPKEKRQMTNYKLNSEALYLCKSPFRKNSPVFLEQSSFLYLCKTAFSQNTDKRESIKIPRTYANHKISKTVAKRVLRRSVKIPQMGN